VPLLVALFIAVPILELYVILEVGSLIGVGPTLAIIVAGALLGSLLLRRQGRSAWRRFNRALGERRFPAGEVADGLAIAIGGALLLTPGFVTDAAGLLLLIPPTRAIVKRLMRGYFLRRFRIVQFPGRSGPTPGPDPGASRSYDFEVSAEEDSPPQEGEPRREEDERRLGPG